MALTSAALLAIPANLCFLEQKFTRKKKENLEMQYIYHYKSTLVDVPFKNVLYDVCTVEYTVIPSPVLNLPLCYVVRRVPL
jgi:hypothetical protein